jgi:cysteinyl-tRNA synthetase
LAVRRKAEILRDQWQELRAAKRYSEADELKRRLEPLGLKLSVTSGGPHVEVKSEATLEALEALQ